MSDREAPDPIDTAYDRAETLLSDEAARASRRTRVLEAVAREAATPSPLPSRRRNVWRRGGWLAAASVAGLGVFVATQIVQPALRQPRVAPSVSGAPPGPTASQTMARSEVPSAPPAAASPPRAAPAAISPPPAAPPPSTPSAPEALPAEPAAPPPPAFAEAEPRPSAARDEALAPQAGGSAPSFAAPSAAASMSKTRSSAEEGSGPAARLRAAAAAGRTGEVRALLDQGVPVDAPDAGGDTALMDSIQAGQPGTAALLRRHGADLDHRNREGRSPRDAAADKDDAAINRALGLDP